MRPFSSRKNVKIATSTVAIKPSVRVDAISKASASLMTEAVKGKTVDEFHRLFERFHGLVTNENVPANDAALGKLAVFAGVRDYPARVKCAILAWHTLRSVFDDTQEVVSTE